LKNLAKICYYWHISECSIGQKIPHNPQMSSNYEGKVEEDKTVVSLSGHDAVEILQETP
jgi:hypothetical protein